MQTLCLLLPVGTDMAARLWSVLERGIEARALCPVAAPAPDVVRLPLAGLGRHSAPDHVAVLASLLRAHLFGKHEKSGGLWLERRELADVLRLIDSGLEPLGDLGEDPEEAVALTLESVSAFLAGIRAQLGMLRMPVRRQPGAADRSSFAAHA